MHALTPRVCAHGECFGAGAVCFLDGVPKTAVQRLSHLAEAQHVSPTELRRRFRRAYSLAPPQDPADRLAAVTQQVADEIRDADPQNTAFARQYERQARAHLDEDRALLDRMFNDGEEHQEHHRTPYTDRDAASYDRMVEIRNGSLVNLENALDLATEIKHTIGDAGPQNPKDREALSKGKTRLDLLEPSANESIAKALAFGADKYGIRNYVTIPIELRVYLAAIQRHLDALKRGEDFAEDSGVSHWGHIGANVHVVEAALEAGIAVDDRKASKPSDIPFNMTRKD